MISHYRDCLRLVTVGKASDIIVITFAARKIYE